MFTLTTLENIINKQWISLPDNLKTEIRLTLWNELMSKHEVMIYFIRNKVAALIVSIARYDWPHLYPDFFSNIVELIKCDGRQCLLGLILAQAASEELGAARDTGVLLPSSRRNQLERLMLKGMPHMLAALNTILEKNAQNEGQSNPPPSPTNGIPQTSVLPDLLANAQDVHNFDKALNMEIVVKCLTTLQHLFSWLPPIVPRATIFGYNCFLLGQYSNTVTEHGGSAERPGRRVRAAVPAVRATPRPPPPPCGCITAPCVYCA
ncbi:hypothetical protein ACJJTC_017871, partial [Scirpophaga incertulas]